MKDSLINSTDALRVLIVADDLTGACDAAGPFAARGARTEARITWLPPNGSTGVLAINTASRDLAEDLSIAKINSMRDVYRSCNPQLFIKKIDSAFRGNTLAEIAATLDIRADCIAILVPAFPAQGRRTYRGQLYCDDETCSTLNIASGLSARGIHPFLLPHIDSRKKITELFNDAIAHGHRFFLCDAATQDDLNSLVDAGRHIQHDVVWIGSGGIAHALANSFFPTGHSSHVEMRLQGPIFFCIGSNHASTSKQIERLCRDHEVTCVDASNAVANRERGKTGRHILLSMNRQAIAEDDLRSLIWSFRINTSGALFLTGGDTGLKICNALSVESISLSHEILPGMPLGTLRGGICDSMPVITKSGGFGNDGTLAALAALCA